MSEQQTTQSLHVPQSSHFSAGGMKSIMDAYKTQSKIQLYDDDSALSCDEISGVKGRDVPLSALRPKAPKGYDEEGKPVYSKSQYAEDMDRRADIRKAYLKMQGVEDTDESYQEEPNRLMQNVQEAEIEYIEDVPDTNEGLLHYLETCISNAEANLEMLKSLYAALSA